MRLLPARVCLLHATNAVANGLICGYVYAAFTCGYYLRAIRWPKFICSAPHNCALYCSVLVLLLCIRFANLCIWMSQFIKFCGNCWWCFCVIAIIRQLSCSQLIKLFKVWLEQKAAFVSHIKFCSCAQQIQMVGGAAQRFPNLYFILCYCFICILSLHSFNLVAACACIAFIGLIIFLFILTL